MKNLAILIQFVNFERSTEQSRLLKFAKCKQNAANNKLLI